MSNRKQYDAKIKLKMTKIFIKNEYSYGEMAEIHGIPKTTMQRWVEIYKSEGPKGFEKVHIGNTNGSRPKAEPQFKSKKDETLEIENERLRAENAYLKKLNALVQERQKQEKKQN